MRTLYRWVITRDLHAIQHARLQQTSGMVSGVAVCVAPHICVLGTIRMLQSFYLCQQRDSVTELRCVPLLSFLRHVPSVLDTFAETSERSAENVMHTKWMYTVFTCCLHLKEARDSLLSRHIQHLTPLRGIRWWRFACSFSGP
jgi:hypothetical protein